MKAIVNLLFLLFFVYKCNAQFYCEVNTDNFKLFIKKEIFTGCQHLNFNGPLPLDIKNQSAFKVLNDLESITISNNEYLSDFDFRNIENQPKLYKVEIINSNLGAITLPKKPMSTITTLTLLNCNISNIDSFDFYFPNLSHLVVSQCHIRNVRFQSNRLKYCNFGHNQIRDIAFIKQLPNLEYLFLDANLIETKDLINLSPLIHLRNLDLSSNRLRYIDSNLFRIDSCTELNLSNNWIDSVFQLSYRLSTHIRTLNLQNNNIQNFDFFSTYISLIRLNLAGNKLKSIDYSHIPINIITLNLSNNELINCDFLDTLIQTQS